MGPRRGASPAGEVSLGAGHAAGSRRRLIRPSARAPFALILAAGASRRFGSPKGLARFKNRTLLDIAVERVRAVAGDHFAVILGANAALLRAAVAISAMNVHELDEWHLGQARSLRAGLAAAPPDAPAVLVTLVDQPLVTARDLDRLVSRWQEHPTQAAAAAYDDVLGAPCILPRSWFAKVMALQGDRGASALLRGSADVISVTMPNAAYDIDTAEDLNRLHQRAASSPTDSATD